MAVVILFVIFVVAFIFFIKSISPKSYMEPHYEDDMDGLFLDYDVVDEPFDYEEDNSYDTAYYDRDICEQLYIDDEGELIEDL